jgi:hypothetical protein
MPIRMLMRMILLLMECSKEDVFMGDAMALLDVTLTHMNALLVVIVMSLMTMMLLCAIVYGDRGLRHDCRYIDERDNVARIKLHAPMLVRKQDSNAYFDWKDWNTNVVRFIESRSH